MITAGSCSIIDPMGQCRGVSFCRKIRQWAKAEPDEDWNVVEEKAELKLKKKIREWADDGE